MAMTYAEQLRHPNWQRKRLEMLNASGWMCQKCCAQEKELHVHHLRYVKGRMAWEYEAEELQVLCNSCHKETHEELDDLVLEFSFVKWADVISLLSGFHCSRNLIPAHNIVRAGAIAQIAAALDPDDSRFLLLLARELLNDTIDGQKEQKAKDAEPNPS